MASQSKGKSSTTVIKCPNISWREATPDGSLILSVVKEAAESATIAVLKKAACLALVIFKTTHGQIVKESKEAYKQIGYESSGLIIAIWRSFKEAEDPKEWLSAEMQDILEDLSHTLESIRSFLDEQLSKNKAIRFMFSRADVKINEYREHLDYAKQRFELQSHMNINDVLIRVLKKDKQTSEQILHRNEAEEENLKHAPEVIDREYARKLPEDKRSLETIAPESSRDREMIAEKSDELKKIEKEIKDQKSELERLQVATREREEANRLMEEEIGAQLRELEDNRQSNKIQARSSGKKSFRHEVEDEEEDAELELRKFEHQSPMNINDILIRVPKRDGQTSQQILHWNEEEKKHPQEIIAREAQDREYAEKLQNELEHPVEIQIREAQDREMAENMQKEWEEAHGLERADIWEKHALEVRDREIAEKLQKEEDEQWHSDELKKIEKETKDRKLELERLRVASRELEEENRLMKAKEEFAQLKRALADNRQSNKIRAKSSKKKSSIQEDVSEEEEEGDSIANEASSDVEEERPVPVRRSSTARTDVSGSRRSAMARMSRPKLSLASASLRGVQETDLEVDSTDKLLDYGLGHAPSPSRMSLSPIEYMPQTLSGTLPYNASVDEIQGFTPPIMELGSPYSGSNLRSASLGSSIPISGMYSDPYLQTNMGSSSSSTSPPAGPYHYPTDNHRVPLMPGLGSVVSSGSNNLINSTISNVGNDNSVTKVYRNQRRVTTRN